MLPTANCRLLPTTDRRQPAAVTGHQPVRHAGSRSCFARCPCSSLLPSRKSGLSLLLPIIPLPMPSLLDDDPPFAEEAHVGYITTLVDRLDASFEGAVTEHLRMSGIYWTLTALSLLRDDDEYIREVMKVDDILEWCQTCYDESTGGFGGNSGDDGHILYTLSCLQILALTNKLSELSQVDRVTDFIVGLQQEDGSFAGDKWGEIDTRFTYCAFSALALLGRLDRVNVRKGAEYILQCRNFDGGFGAVIGAESHAGQVFCCIGALSIAQSLDLLSLADVDLLGWWLCERQCDSGGLNGRPEKQADVCYSWWILSALSILGRVSWINTDKLARFILKCQDEEDGGIADRPDDMVDIFHTFFGIAGLSLLGHLHRPTRIPYREIDPVYALPTDVVQRLDLPGQVTKLPPLDVDDRLKRYNLYTPK